MSSITTFLMVALAVLSLSLEDVNGLNCYDCLYYTSNGTEAEGSEDSCAQGRLPDADLLIECGANNTLATLTRDDQGVVHLASGKELVEAEDMIYGCSAIYGIGNLGDSEVDAVARGCLGYRGFETNVTEECRTMTLENWYVNASTDLMAFAVSVLATGFDLDTDISGCYCKEDGCNEQLD